MKLKYFFGGLELGSALGIIASFMTDKKTGRPIKEEVRNFVGETSSDVKNITLNAQRAQKDVDSLENKDIPQVKRNIGSIERSFKEFKYSIQPNLEAIKATTDKLNSEVKNLK